MMDQSGIDLPRELTANLPETQMETMIIVTLGLDPLWENCLSKDWKSITTMERVKKYNIIDAMGRDIIRIYRLHYVKLDNRHIHRLNSQIR